MFINGERVTAAAQQGFAVGGIEDITHYLHIGKNVIAVSTHRRSVDGIPAIAVEGAYSLSDGVHAIGCDDEWRCSTAFERRAGWWFLPEFDDRQWAVPLVRTMTLRAKVNGPPDAVACPRIGHWITVARGPRSIVVRRSMPLSRRPQSAWLRITANATYRLAINGVVVEHQEQSLGTIAAVTPVERTYDITTFLGAGNNDVSMSLTSPTGTPAVLADLVVSDDLGRRTSYGTDQQWEGQNAIPEDWPGGDSANSAGWRPCHAEVGDLGVLPWEPEHQSIQLDLPFEVLVPRLLLRLAISLAIGLAAYLACRLVGGCFLQPHTSNQLHVSASQRLSNIGGTTPATPPRRGAFSLLAAVPLLPVAVGIAAAIFATSDPRIARQDLYQVQWIFAAILAVCVQWIWMMLAARFASAAPSGKRLLFCRRGGMFLTTLFLIAIVFLGGWLRERAASAEGIQMDESYQALVADGFRERGIPSRMLEPDQPIVYIATSELTHFVVGLTSLFEHWDKLMNRGPAIVWGVLAIWLLYLLGRRLFNREVGLLAAAIGAVSPYCIHMSNWGRYPSQLHFLTLATIYCYWRTIEADGPISRRWLWLTVVSFIAMFLSWEVSAFVAIGMIIAALLQRRGQLRHILLDGHVWIGMLLVSIAIVLQYCHREFQQAQRMYFGYGDTKITLAPMWQYPSFELLGYMVRTTWSESMVLPTLGFLGGVVLCIRHRYQKGARFLVIVFTTTCFAMALLMPLTLWRYIFHLVPLLILISAAALVAGGRAIVQFVAEANARLLRYARCAAAVAVVGTAAVGCGWTIQDLEVPQRLSSGPPQQESQTPRPPNGLWFADFTGPMKYVLDHWQEGDVILTDLPMFTGHLMRESKGAAVEPNSVTLWVESCQKREASLSDENLAPAHRMEGTVMVSSREALHSLFVHHKRVWCVATQFLFIGETNDADVTGYIEQNMEVVYEDHLSVVMLADNNHRTAALRGKDAASLKRSAAHWGA